MKPNYKNIERETNKYELFLPPDDFLMHGLHSPPL